MNEEKNKKLRVIPYRLGSWLWEQQLWPRSETPLPSDSSPHYVSALRFSAFPSSSSSSLSLGLGSVKLIRWLERRRESRNALCVAVGPTFLVFHDLSLRYRLWFCLPYPVLPRAPLCPECFCVRVCFFRSITNFFFFIFLKKSLLIMWNDLIYSMMNLYIFCMEMNKIWKPNNFFLEFFLCVCVCLVCGRTVL